MESLATTRLSTKGQVVIPAEIRDRLGLEPGAQFVVVGDADTVILRRVTLPSAGEYRGLLERARRAARRAGLKPSEVDQVISRVRRAVKRRGG
jgi:AbrB family looped-hinge helix DNA binding protein